MSDDARLNELGQPIGPALPGWQPPARPAAEVLQGRYCLVEPLAVARHARALFDANGEDREQRMWTYLYSGPYATFDEYQRWLLQRESSTDPLFRVFVDRASGRAVGLGSYMRIDPPAGSIEVGHIAMSPLLQRTPAATEAMYLMMRHAFELGYRRYEWKCDSLNQNSRRAAERLGFTFEGMFRQAAVYKGRSRDTAWYSVIDAEWPLLREAFECWLDPGNFDASGAQRARLGDLRDALKARGSAGASPQRR
jgi:RimJ/RimL family protein N-acetyltransferase